MKEGDWKGRMERVAAVLTVVDIVFWCIFWVATGDMHLSPFWILIGLIVVTAVVIWGACGLGYLVMKRAGDRPRRV